MLELNGFLVSEKVEVFLYFWNLKILSYVSYIKVIHI